MSFQRPEWDPKDNSYSVNIKNWQQFQYSEVRSKSSGEDFFSSINTNNNNKFNDILNNIANTLFTEGSEWFASPIKPQLFLKKIKHNFETPNMNQTYGTNVEFTWAPIQLKIIPTSFLIHWRIIHFKDQTNIIPSDFIQDFDDIEELEPKTIVIQQNEIIENVDIPFDNSEKPIHVVSSRALMKQKVRQAKLKAAIATMKAERMAEKYFRRYGIETQVDSDSELSFDSYETDSEEDNSEKE